MTTPPWTWRWKTSATASTASLSTRVATSIQRTGAILLAAQHVLDSVEQPLALPVGASRSAVERAGELLEQLALLVGQLLRHRDAHPDLVVAAAVAAQVRHPALLESDHAPALGTGRNLDPGCPVDGRHLDLVAERGLGDVDRQVEHDVV